MSKKTIAFILTAIMVISMMAACGNTTSPSASPEATPTASAETNASAAPTDGDNTNSGEEYVPTYPIVAEKVTFTASVPNDKVADHIWYKAYEEATNVAIDWQYWSDWNTQLGVALASDSTPDLIFNLTNAGLDKATVLKYGQQNYFINYKDYLHLMPDLVALMDANPESYKAVENPDGSMYALPQFLQTLTAMAGTVYYRTDMFEEAGVAVPTTTDELLQAVKDLQAYFGKDNSSFVAMQPYASTHLASQLMYYLFPAFGDEIDMSFGAIDGSNVTYNYTSDQYRHMLEYMNELYNSGGFDKNIFSEDGTNAKAVILANNTAITTYGTAYSADNFAGDSYDVDMFAPLTSEYTSAQKYAKKYPSNMASMEISAKCSDIETLVKWVNALYTSEENAIAPGVSAITMWLGVKDTDWSYDDASQETYTIHVPEGYDGAATNWLMDIGFSSSTNCIFMSLNSASPGLLCKGVGTRDKLLPYAVDIFPATFLSFTDEESTALAESFTDIQTFVTQNQATFITEGVTDDSWNGYVSAIESMGMSKVLDVYQAAFERYNN